MTRFTEADVLTIDELEKRIAAFDFRRPIKRGQIHHTASPSRADWQELIDAGKSPKQAAAILGEGMYRWHTEGRGFSDIAQHVSHMPDGLVLVARDWNKIPAGITGWNTGSFMTEIVGDLRIDHEYPMPPAQRESVVRTFAALNKRVGLFASDLIFHKEKAATECPGDIDKGRLVSAIAHAMEAEESMDTEPFEEVWKAARSFFDSFLEAVR